MKRLAVLAGLLAMASAAHADDFWERPPLQYSATTARDPLTRLAEGISDGSVALEGATALARVREILALLHIPEDSQILVFSKTSKQNSLISPWNPRAIYFSSDAYAAYVPGGDMEIVTHDPLLGPVFHLVDVGERDTPGQSPLIRRTTTECLSCHATARTGGMPGVMVRSVFTDADGQILGGLGSVDVTTTTPISQRWGGYYVTGSSSIPNLGNRSFTPAGEAIGESPAFTTLDGRIPVEAYLRPTSDIVALLVLEHQCQVYNLLTAASYRYRWASWMARSLDPHANPDQGTAGQLADEHARGIADALLFKGAAPMGDGVEGSVAFQAAFAKACPATRDGQSLADFHLGQKLFKNRCSYMIYSHAFRTLPPRVTSAVVSRLREILEGPEDLEGYEYLSQSERARIVSILKETWPSYP